MIVTLMLLANQTHNLCMITKGVNRNSYTVMQISYK